MSLNEKYAYPCFVVVCQNVNEIRTSIEFTLVLCAYHQYSKIRTNSNRNYNNVCYLFDISNHATVVNDIFIALDKFLFKLNFSNNSRELSKKIEKREREFPGTKNKNPNANTLVFHNIQRGVS